MDFSFNGNSGESVTVPNQLKYSFLIQKRVARIVINAEKNDKNCSIRACSFIHRITVGISGGMESTAFKPYLVWCRSGQATLQPSPLLKRACAFPSRLHISSLIQHSHVDTRHTSEGVIPLHPISPSVDPVPLTLRHHPLSITFRFFYFAAAHCFTRSHIHSCRLVMRHDFISRLPFNRYGYTIL